MRLHFNYYLITSIKDGENYFIFIFVLFSNLIELIPYRFTTTSHLIVTFTLSLSIFVGINSICIQKHKFQMLALFIPSNTSFGLALLLVPIELLSYIFNPLSEFVTRRLFSTNHKGIGILYLFVYLEVSARVFLLPVIYLVLLKNNYLVYRIAFSDKVPLGNNSLEKRVE